MSLVLKFWVLDFERREPVEVAGMDEVVAWAMEGDNYERTVLAREERDGVVVSTVFLLMSPSWNGAGPKFETMVFDAAGGTLWERKYATWDEAQVGHDAAVERWIG